ncbi:MAG: anaerobic ribonucleoside-triphosphate reductase activating protein [Bacillus sp. (in: firmicutes)]
MKIRVAAPLMFDSIVDGPGLRMVLWTQGCPHRCKGCHNPQTHTMDGGFELGVEEIIASIRSSKLQRGITLSGGEPFLQACALQQVALEAKKCGLDVWAYTGYKWEQLLNKRNPLHEEYLSLLRHVDVLVDGRFIEEQKSHELLFRGSANQRIIDVPASLDSKSVILYK